MIITLLRGTEMESINADDFEISDVTMAEDGTADVTVFYMDEDVPVPLVFKGITNIKFSL